MKGSCGACQLLCMSNGSKQSMLVVHDQINTAAAVQAAMPWGTWCVLSGQIGSRRAGPRCACVHLLLQGSYGYELQRSCLQTALGLGALSYGMEKLGGNQAVASGGCSSCSGESCVAAQESLHAERLCCRLCRHCMWQ